MSSKEVAVYASAARTATPTPAVVACGYARGVHLVIDVTAVGVTPSVTVTLELQDLTSGKWYPLLTSAAISTVSTTVMRVYPGAPVAANLSANDTLTEALRITVTHGNGTTITYSVSAHLIN